VQELVNSTCSLHYPKCEVTEVQAATHGRLGRVSFKNGDGEISTVDADELIVAVGFLADLGPLKSWGFELQKNQIVVDIITMQTSIDGVFAAGDVCWYPAKFRLIATGAAEAVTAVNHAVVHNDPGTRLDPGHSTNIMAARETAS
jgi:thioredoxin reductase (NADPH)